MTRADWLLAVIVAACLPLLYHWLWQPAGPARWVEIQSGDAPSLRSLKGARLAGQGPRGETATVRVKGFPTFGGKPSDARFGRTGRVDVHVTPDGGSEPVGLQWEMGLAGG